MPPVLTDKRLLKTDWLKLKLRVLCNRDTSHYTTINPLIVFQQSDGIYLMDNNCFMKFKLNTYTGSFIYTSSIFKKNWGQSLTKSLIHLITTKKINKSTVCWRTCSTLSHEHSQTQLWVLQGRLGPKRGSSHRESGENISFLTDQTLAWMQKEGSRFRDW